MVLNYHSRKMERINGQISEEQHVNANVCRDVRHIIFVLRFLGMPSFDPTSQCEVGFYVFINGKGESGVYT